MSTVTKPKIDPAMEDGAIALAEELLPASDGRREDLEDLEALESAWRPFAGTRDRIEAALKRSDEIAEELKAYPPEPARKKLLAERTALTGELVHAGSDIETVAEPYAAALGAWAEAAETIAKIELRKISAEQEPLHRERERVRARLNPDLPKDRPSDTEAQGLQGEFDQLTERIQVFRDREGQIERARGAIGQAISKFGDRGYSGQLFTSRGQREWLQGIRRRYAAATTDKTGLADMLKPMGT